MNFIAPLFRHLFPRLLVITLFLSFTACDQQANQDARKFRAGKKTRAQLVEVQDTLLQQLKSYTTRSGTLRALNTVKIFNQEEGQIREVRFYPGDRFRKNSTLVQLDDSLLRAQLDKATASRIQAQQDLDRLNKLVKKRLAAEDERARAATALKVAKAEEALLKTRMAYSVIRAPFDGIVTERKIEPGDIAPRYTHLLTVIDPTSLITRVEVSELLLPSLKTGNEVKIQIDALPGKVLKGRIHRIYPTVNQFTRKGTIEVSLKQVPEGAREGQFCRVTLAPPSGKYLMIPFSALRRDEQGEFVYRVEQNKVQKVYVHTGIRDGNLIVVLDGLEHGSRVVTKGFLGLRNGMNIKIHKQASSGK